MILNIGLSPAWQQILLFDGLSIGDVNRARESFWCASGKVLNVGRALKSLNAEVLTVAPIGGFTGERIRSEFAENGVPACWIGCENSTRVCTTLLDQQSGKTTELVAETAPLSAKELARFEETVHNRASEATMLVISGSFPPGVPPAFCCELLQRTTVPTVLDIRGPQLTAALEGEPFLVKPNREELAETLAIADVDADVLPDAMRTLNERGAQWVVVSQGKADVWMTSRTKTFRFSPPACDAVNPIGCGDCLTAGIAAGLTNGFSPRNAVRFGIAAAAENLRQILPARLNSNSVTESYRQIQMNIE